MAITKDGAITASDVNSLITQINNELSRRGLTANVPAVSSTVAIDDTVLDNLAAKMVAIRGSHCYCQTHGGIVSHKGCPSHTPPTLQSAQVDAGVKLYASETTAPDFSDVQSDYSALAAKPACSPQWTCPSNCGCNGVSNFCTECPSHCSCNSVCSCQVDCGCNKACGCNKDCTCNTNTVIGCSCDLVCYFVEGNENGCVEDQEYGCLCDKVCSCQTNCDCQSVCNCQTACDCNTFCSCQSACSCNSDCSCQSQCTCQTNCDCNMNCGCEFV